MKRSRKSEKTLTSCMDEMRQHSDILSHAMCARNECDSRNRTRTKKTNNYAHIHVFPKCVTSLLGFMCFVLMFLWILAFTLSLVSDVSPFSMKVLYVNCISPRIRNTKYKSSFLLDVAVRLCPVIVNSICIPNSRMFHIAKTGLLGCCVYTLRRSQ